MGDAVSLSGVVAGYERARDVLHGIDAELAPGSFTAVIGPNGCGKSTLMKLLAGLLAPRAGEVRVGSLDPARTPARVRARRIAYLPQADAADVAFTAFELVLMGRFPYQGWLPFDRAQDLEVAERCLAAVEATALRDRLLPEMSGGERQRVQLARALAQEPSLLLLDEPASHLDLKHQVETYELLARLHRDHGTTVVVVSHDLNLPGVYADGILVLSEGRRAAFGPPAAILRAVVLEPVYGVRIVEAEAAGHEHPILVPLPTRS